jgi:replicative DNA helicase
MAADAPTLNRGAEVLPPHSTDAEESVLGSLLIDPAAMLAVADQLHAEDFYHAKSRTLFAAFERLHTRQVEIDFTTVMDELERTHELDDLGGVSYLSGLLGTVPTSIHVEHYAAIVARTAVLRRLIQAGTEITKLGYADTDDLDRTLSEADRLLGKVTRQRGAANWLSITDASLAFLESIQVGEAGDEGVSSAAVPTGFQDLDRLLGGFHAGDLVILAARPGFGKSSLALGIADTVARHQQRSVGLFTLEMSGLQIAGRLLSALADVDVARLREGRVGAAELRRISEAHDRLAEMPLWIDDSSSLSLRELEIRARRLHAEHPLSLLVVDYLQLVHSSGENRVQAIGAISRALKGLAGELGCPVLALSQLSRSVEHRSPHIPQLSDLRESGDLEQDADLVMFIYREDQYDRETEQKGIAEIHVAKQRNGPTGIVSLLFLERNARFVSLGVV